MKTQCTFTIDLTDQEEVQAVVNTLVKLLIPNTEAKPTTGSGAPVKTEKTAPKKSTKADSAPDEFKEHVAQIEKEEEAEVAQTNAPATGTTKDSIFKLEDVRSRLASKIEQHRPLIKTEFDKYGIKNIASLPAEHFESFMTFLAGLK